MQRGKARDVGALLADRLDTAENDVVDECRVEPVAVADGPQHPRRKIDRRDLVQCAVRPPASAWCANVVIDVAFGHRSPRRLPVLDSERKITTVVPQGAG